MIKGNKKAGDNARDFIAKREGNGALIEQSFQTTGGLRRLDVLVNGLQRTAIESKVGRTRLSDHIRREIARDIKLLRANKIDKVQWEFFISSHTGKGGPTKELLQKLQKLGKNVILHDKSF